MRNNPAMAERREIILALLEERPYRTVDLAALLGLESGMHQVCAQLAREGVINRLIDGRWAHPTHTNPSPPAPKRWTETAPAPDDVDDAIASDAEELEDLDAAADDEEELPPVPQRARGQRVLYPAGTRQTAKAQTSKLADEPAWWVKHAGPEQRDAFMGAAAARNTEMSEKSPAWRSQTMPNKL